MEEKLNGYHCCACGSKFTTPEYKKPDAGFTFQDGILGLRTMDPVAFCPECLSTKIKRER